MVKKLIKKLASFIKKLFKGKKAKKKAPVSAAKE